MPPGPGLATVLAGLDRAALSGSDLIVLARARARQLAYDQAQLLADVDRIARQATDGFDEADRVECPDKVSAFADDEVAAAMTWTSITASHQLELAHHSIHRLPALHAAMLAGRIDAAKAKVCYQAVQVLDNDHLARAIIDRVLPEASEKTTAQLRAKLARLVIKADPDAARRRYRNGLENRRVDHGQEQDGTWLLGGRFLPAPQATAAYAHLDALASAHHHAGDPRGLDQLRADLFLDLLTGAPIPAPPNPDPAEQPAADDTADPADPATGADAAAEQPGADTSPVTAGGLCPTCRGVPGR